MRFLLGAAEAGFFPGIVRYLTFWFPTRHQASAFAVCMSAQVISLIFGAPLSGLILDHIHWLNHDSWRWLFVIEGIPAILFGIVTFYLPDRPKNASFLDQEEQRWLQSTVDRERVEKERKTKISKWQALTNRRVLYFSFIYLCIVLGIYGVTFYLPAIVKSLKGDFSHTAVGFISAIPFVVGGIAMLAFGRNSDRTLERRLHVAAATACSTVGLVLLANTKSSVLSVVALSITAIGAYGYIAPFWALPALFLTEASAAVGIAVINTIGNLGGFLGPYSLQVVNGDPDNPGASPQSLYLLAASFAVATVALLLLKVEREKRLDTAAAGDASPDGRPALDGQVPEARSPAGRHVER